MVRTSRSTPHGVLTKPKTLTCCPPRRWIASLFSKRWATSPVSHQAFRGGCGIRVSGSGWTLRELFPGRNTCMSGLARTAPTDNIGFSSLRLPSLRTSSGILGVWPSTPWTFHPRTEPRIQCSDVRTAAACAVLLQSALTSWLLGGAVGWFRNR